MMNTFEIFIQDRMLLVLVFILIVINSGAQPTKQLSLDAKIPLDPEVRYNRLDNGFTYYIRKNEQPKGKVVMCLSVKVGTFMETEGELDFAHLLEHTAFRGTKNFPTGVSNYLETHGVKLGVDVNASTGFEYTTYKFTIPAENPELVNRCLQILRDWCDGILLRQEIVDAEWGAVVSETMLSSGYEMRKMTSIVSEVFGDTRLGTVFNSPSKESIKEIDRNDLISFYREWYRADLQAVVIVGDIDMGSVEEKVKSLFSDLKTPVSKGTPNDFNVELNGSNQFLTFTNDEIHDVSIEIVMKHPANPFITISDYKTSVIAKVYNEIMRLRFKEVQSRYNLPFDHGGSSFDENPIFLDLGISSLFSNIRCRQPEFIKPTFCALMLELERVDRYGFTEEELSHAKDVLLKEGAEKQGSNSSDLMNDYLLHFVKGYAAPDPHYKNEMIRVLVNETSLKEVNAAAAKWISDINRFIVISAPHRIKSLLPTEATVLGWIEEVSDGKIDRFPPTTKVVKELIAANKLPKFPKDVKRHFTVKEIDVTEIDLANGVKVIMKPVKSEGLSPSLVLLHGFSPGGASLYNGIDYTSCSYAAAIVYNSGVGGLNKFEIQRYLAGRQVDVSPYIDDSSEGITGSAASNEFETMLQLVYQYFVSPNKSENAFEDWKNQQLRSFERHGVSFYDTINAVMNGEKTNKLVLTKENIRKIQLDRVFHLYKNRFSDAGDFTFIITGSFDVNEMISHAVRYLGGLPSKGKSEETKRLNIPKQKEMVGKVIYSGRNENNASVELRFSGEYVFNSLNNIKLVALERILQIVLHQRLREQDGGTYNVLTSVHYLKSLEDRGNYIFQIGFSCSPDNIEAMISSVWEEIDHLKKFGPNKEVLDKMVTLENESFKSKIKSSDFWLHYLVKQYRNRENPKELLNTPSMLNLITSEDIRDTAEEKLNTQNYLKFILL